MATASAVVVAVDDVVVLVVFFVLRSRCFPEGQLNTVS